VTTAVPSRQPAGWLVSAGILYLLISSAISGTFHAANPKSKDPAVQTTNLEAYVRAQAAAKAAPKDAQGILAQVKLTPTQIAEAIQPVAKKGPRAALLYCEVLTELKQPIPADVVAVLQTDKDPDVKMFGAIYGSPSPSPDALRKLASEIPHSSFLTKFARVQALELAGDKNVRDTTFGMKLEKPGVKNSLIYGAAVLVPLMLCIGLLFFYTDSRSRGLLGPLGHPLAPETDRESDRLAMRAAQLLGLLVLSSFAALIPWSSFLPKSASTAMDLVAPDLVLIVGALLLTFLPIMGKTISLADYGITRQGAKTEILWGLGGFFGGMPLVLSGGLVFLALTTKFFPSADHPLSQTLEDPKNGILVGSALFVAAVGAPIFEEILFRGTILPALVGLFRNSKWRTPIAIAISSVLFAACHPQGIPSWGVLGGIAALNSLLCYQTKSIVPGMIVHVLWNSLIVVFTLASQG
jgi:membrane protease YdiL (CAAX protease family)